MPNLAVAVANARITTVAGVFYRHSSRRQAVLGGSDAGGRWGPPKAFQVLYLARPFDSAVIEAYRWNVDPVEGMTAAQVAPRKLWTVEVHIRDVLDLTDQTSRDTVGLTAADLSSPLRQYGPTQAVARAAHQLNLHGILAPAAEGGGQTLAVFDSALTPQESLTVQHIEDGWRLPNDPRRQESREAPRPPSTKQR